MKQSSGFVELHNGPLEKKICPPTILIRFGRSPKGHVIVIIIIMSSCHGHHGHVIMSSSCHVMPSCHQFIIIMSSSSSKGNVIICKTA